MVVRKLLVKNKMPVLVSRKAANEKFRAKYEAVIDAEEEDIFLTPEEETLLRKIVTETGIRFVIEMLHLFSMI